MKSNSLTNRILALALTLVMILGMLPSGIVSAEAADTVTPPAASESEVSYVAEVNGTKYETVEAAIAAAQSGDTVALMSDTTAAGPITIDKDITLNLNGFTLTLPERDNYAIVLKNSLTINGEGNVVVNGLYGIGLSTSCTGGLTINGGNFTGANADYLIGAYNGKVIINGGTLTAAYCVVNSFDGYNAVVEINGGALTAELPVLGVNTTVSEDATLNASEFLCVSNGTYYNDLETAIAEVASGSTITLLGDTTAAGPITIDKDLTLKLNGHTLTLPEHNNYAIVVKKNLTIEGGNVVVKGLYGIGLSTSCTGTLTVNANITGANADYLIGAFNGKVVINGGTLTAAYCVVNSFDGYNAVVEINGGTLTAELPVLGVNTTVSENVTLNASEFLCVSGGTYYNDLATAIAEAAPGSTITLLSSGMGSGAVINKNLTIDFGGFTYSFTEGVGSTGTPSNGLQILTGNKVVLKDGTLNVADGSADQFYILVQNYADLTVSAMTLDGPNLDKWSATDGDSYALSINSGNGTIENTTIIANNDGALAYAFDVCQYQTYATPTVTFNSGTVKGAVDVSSIGASTFVIEGGQFQDNALIGYVPYGKTMDETGKVITDTVIDTERELRDAIAKGGEVTLGADIALTGPVTIDKAVTLNLNGFPMTLPEHNNYAIVV